MKKLISRFFENFWASGVHQLLWFLAIFSKFWGFLDWKPCYEFLVTNHLPIFNTIFFLKTLFFQTIKLKSKIQFTVIVTKCDRYASQCNVLFSRLRFSCNSKGTNYEFKYFHIHYLSEMWSFLADFDIHMYVPVKIY